MTASQPVHKRQRGRYDWRDRSGSAVLEFALMAPILLSLLLGVGDLAPTAMVKFKVGNATQSVADLTSQFSTVQSADLTNLFASGVDVMAPFSSTNLILRVTNIASDGNGNAFVYWSCGQGTLQPLIALDPITSTPTGTPLSNLIYVKKKKTNGYNTNGTNTSYVMVETQYTYTAPARFILPSPQLMSITAYTFPRLSSYIGHLTSDPNYVPTAPASATHVSSEDLGDGISCSFAS